MEIIRDNWKQEWRKRETGLGIVNNIYRENKKF
jgi:hypothetical protein